MNLTSSRVFIGGPSPVRHHLRARAATGSRRLARRAGRRQLEAAYGLKGLAAGEEARFEVSRNGEIVAMLAPQKRRYLASGSVMTEAAIDGGLFRDLYVAMGEPIGEAASDRETGALAMRLHYKPMVRWMWLGAIMMAVGGFTTVFDKRYRRQRSSVQLGAGAEVAHGA